MFLSALVGRQAVSGLHSSPEPKQKRAVLVKEHPVAKYLESQGLTRISWFSLSEAPPSPPFVFSNNAN